MPTPSLTESYALLGLAPGDWELVTADGINALRRKAARRVAETQTDPDITRDAVAQETLTRINQAADLLYAFHRKKEKDTEERERRIADHANDPAPFVSNGGGTQPEDGTTGPAPPPSPSPPPSLNPSVIQWTMFEGAWPPSPSRVRVANQRARATGRVATQRINGPFWTVDISRAASTGGITEILVTPREVTSLAPSRYVGAVAISIDGHTLSLSIELTVRVDYEPKPPAPPVDSPAVTLPVSSRATRTRDVAVAVLVAALIIGAAVSVPGGKRAVHAAGSSGASSGQLAASPQPSLPRTASTSFTATSSFQPAADASPTFAPSQQSWEVSVRVDVTYAASSLDNVNGGAGSVGERALDSITTSTMTIKTPNYAGYSGDSYTEAPLRAHLSVQGTRVTGDLSYAAVLPGQYSIADFGSDNTGDIGTVSTSNLGVSFGGALGNGLVVLAVRKATNDIVVVFGAVGSTGTDNLYPDKRTMCITDGEPPVGFGAALVVHPDQVQIVDRRDGTQPYYGATAWYILGTARFPVSHSALGQGAFFFNCGTGDRGVTF